jgi:hypothetical protein
VTGVNPSRWRHLSRGGLSAGIYPEPAKFADNWRFAHRFKPAMSAATRERKLAGWARALKGLRASDEGGGVVFFQLSSPGLLTG